LSPLKGTMPIPKNKKKKKKKILPVTLFERFPRGPLCLMEQHTYNCDLCN
jgi:hypothetical protein